MGDRLQFGAAPVAAGYAAATYQNFSVVRQFYFASGQNLANRAAAGVEGMIQADQRSCFGQPVSLNHGVSQAMPEVFSVAIESSAAADYGPEFPSELAANSAKRPPATQKVLVRGRGVARGKAIAATRITLLDVAFELVLQ